MRSMLLRQFRDTADFARAATTTLKLRVWLSIGGGLLNCWFSGLKEDIKTEMTFIGPRSLDHAIELGVQIEAKLNFGPKKKWESKGSYAAHIGRVKPIIPQFIHKNPTNTYPYQTHLPSYSNSLVYSPKFQNSTYLATKNPNSIPVAKPFGDVRRLGEKELQYKRERGLCFCCDEKWAVGHRCKRKELSILLGIEEGEVDCGSFEDLT